MRFVNNGGDVCFSPLIVVPEYPSLIANPPVLCFSSQDLSVLAL